MSFPFGLFEISGHSMEPFLHHGDKVLVWKWRKPKVGDVVVFKVNTKEKFWVKRVRKVLGDELLVEGDNKKDSLEIGKVKMDQIVGIVTRLKFGY